MTAASETVRAGAGVAVLPGCERSRSQRSRKLLRVLLPSLTDLLFLILLCVTYGFLGQRLLADSDIGWHIRNGEHMFAMGSVPQADYFSYTMTGRPWYAWEWLYDAVIAGIHHLAGLNGVVLFSAAIFALTFTLLFRLAWRGSRSVPIALCLTLLAAAAASIHLLARPHLLTWLFTLIWFDRLNAFQRGRARNLLALPLLIPLWVNLHGGFLIGVALQALFLTANLWTVLTTSSPLWRSLAWGRLRHLSVVLLLTLAATLITPYGYRLYVHLHGYLTDTYLMDHILEFLSPNFHLFQVKAFALLLMVVLVALALSGRTARMLDIMIVAFAVWAGLYAARNIPLAAILLTVAISPWLGAALRRMTRRTDIAIAWRRLAGKVDGLSAWMGAMEERLAGHVWPVMILALLMVTAPAASSRKATMIAFNEKQQPVKAAEYMAAHNIRDHFFSPDSWGGYLIYRLYPNVRLMMDDRHDFYGASYVRNYLTMLQVGPGWRKLLDANHVNWVLAPRDSSLANALKAVPDWRVIHEDETAVIFERVVPLDLTAQADSNSSIGR